MTEVLTVEAFDAAMRAIRDRPAGPPRHDCRFDGHVEHFCSERCVYCGAKIRSLDTDERHILLGEFA